MSDERSGLLTSRSVGLVDLLDRILDKGLVIAGDIKISLVNVELLTLKIRLVLCSIEKAEQIGLDWWRYDPEFIGLPAGADGRRALEGAGKERLPEPEPQVKELGPAEAEQETPTAAPPAQESGAKRRGQGRKRSQA